MSCKGCGRKVMGYFKELSQHLSGKAEEAMKHLRIAGNWFEFRI
jgi:hypothetical protein